MSIEKQPVDMDNGRALLTERERDAIRGEKSDSYRYKTRTYLRSRLDELATDIDLLREQEPELYQELRETVVEDGEGRVDNTPAETVAEADNRDTEPVDEDTGNTDDPLTTAVEKAADGWDATGEKLANRKAAARAVLEFAREGGEVSKKEAKETLYPEYPVAGQNARTWYRKNIRPVLNETAEYDSSRRAYVLDEESR